MFFYHLIVSKAVGKMTGNIIHRENETKCACDCGLRENSMITELVRFKDLIIGTHQSADQIFDGQCIQVHLRTSDNMIGH